MEKKLSSKEWFQEFEVKIIMKSIWQAIEFCHHKNIVHRDLKPGRFFFI